MIAIILRKRERERERERERFAGQVLGAAAPGRRRRAARPLLPLALQKVAAGRAGAGGSAKEERAFGWVLGGVSV